MTERRPEPLPQVLKIKPYVPGHAPESDGGKTYKLASNENPLGASPAARKAVIDATTSLEIYPDGDAGQLRRVIGRRYGLDPDRIMCGAGSDEIFQLLARAFLTAGDNIVQSQYGFLVYQLVAQQSGAETRFAADDETLTASVDAMLAQVDDRTKIVFLANPNNPTGTYLPISEVRRLHAGLRPDVLLVLDAAYAEYVRRNDYEAGVELVSSYENVLMTRTFSKIHGLAALRLGWCYGPLHVIDALHRVRGPFNISAPAQAAGIAALEDADFVEKSVEHNTRELARLSDGLRALGLKPIDSVANFVLVRFSQNEGRKAPEAAAFLETGGVSVRAVGAYGLPEYLRISVGETDGVDAVLKGLEDFLSRDST